MDLHGRKLEGFLSATAFRLKSTKSWILANFLTDVFSVDELAFYSAMVSNVFQKERMTLTLLFEIVYHMISNYRYKAFSAFKG